jgi:hypothetical protein
MCSALVRLNPDIGERVARDRDRNIPPRGTFSTQRHPVEKAMGGLIYLVGLIVVIMFILSLLGLR